VQPAGPLFCSARQTADNSCFSFGNTAFQAARPAGPPFSVIYCAIVLLKTRLITSVNTKQAENFLKMQAEKR